MNRMVATAFSLLTGCFAAATCLAQPQPFTYQGQLKQDGNPMNGSAELTFRLYSASAGGTMYDVQTISNVPVSDGLFSVVLGDEPEYRFYGAFDGSPRWMEVQVNGTTLSPRQQITLAPQATFAIEAGSLTLPANISATVPGTLFLVNNGGGNGLHGQTSGNNNAGVYGHASATSGATYGIAGRSYSGGGAGAHGSNEATSGAAIGGYFVSNFSSTAIGCVGRANQTGVANGSFGGVFDNYASSGFATGVAGTSTSNSNGFGVRGVATATNGFTVGTYGLSLSPSGYGGYFHNTGGGIGLKVSGTAQVDVLQILGADLSESFDITGGEVEPGMVVSIDPAHPGQLMPACNAYDNKVAGVVAGAGGINTGVVMSQPGTIADGKHPVAMTGRVYCYVDASNGAVRPGDLLTTSDVAGHAMKVCEPARAQGAVIGKAMTALESGRGLVLVLVNLQ